MKFQVGFVPCPNCQTIFSTKEDYCPDCLMTQEQLVELLEAQATEKLNYQD